MFVYDPIEYDDNPMLMVHGDVIDRHYQMIPVLVYHSIDNLKMMVMMINKDYFPFPLHLDVTIVYNWNR